MLLAIDTYLIDHRVITVGKSVGVLHGASIFRVRLAMKRAEALPAGNVAFEIEISCRNRFLQSIVCRSREAEYRRSSLRKIITKHAAVRNACNSEEEVGAENVAVNAMMSSRQTHVHAPVHM